MGPESSWGLGVCIAYVRNVRYICNAASLHPASMPSKLDSLLAKGHRRLEELLESEGLAARPLPGLQIPGAGRPGGASEALLLQTPKEEYLVLLRGVLGNPSFESVSRALAEAILTARAAAGRDRRPLALVVGTPLTASMAARLKQYQAWSDPRGDWGLLDPSGAVWIRFGRFQIEVESPDVGRRAAPERALTPFTDQGQWLLKVLLAPDIDSSLLRAPRLRAKTDAELAKAADLSTSTVSRVLAGLESLGFLDRNAASHRLVRIPELLDAWRGAVAHTVRERGARFLLPGGDALGRLSAALRKTHGALGTSQQPRACLALFSACKQLGVGHVVGAPVHLYHEDPSPNSLQLLGLRLTGPLEPPEVLIRRPAFPRALFRAAPLIEGVPTADALQCWLDLSQHPLRGREQAHELIARLGLPRVEPQ